MPLKKKFLVFGMFVLLIVCVKSYGHETANDLTSKHSQFQPAFTDQISTNNTLYTPSYIKNSITTSMTQELEYLFTFIVSQASGGLGQGVLLNLVDYFFGGFAGWLSDLSLDLLTAQSTLDRSWRVATSQLRYTHWLSPGLCSWIINIPLMVNSVKNLPDRFYPLKFGVVPIIIDEPELKESYNFQLILPFQTTNPGKLILSFLKPYHHCKQDSLGCALTDLSNIAWAEGIETIEIQLRVEEKQTVENLIMGVSFVRAGELQKLPDLMVGPAENLTWLSEAVRHRSLITTHKLEEEIPTLSWHLWHRAIENRAIVNPLSDKMISKLHRHIREHVSGVVSSDDEFTPVDYPIRSGYFLTTLHAGSKSGLWIDMFSGQETLHLMTHATQPNMAQLQKIDIKRLMSDSDWLTGHPPLPATSVTAHNGYLNGQMLSLFHGWLAGQKQDLSYLPGKSKLPRHVPTPTTEEAKTEETEADSVDTDTQPNDGSSFMFVGGVTRGASNWRSGRRDGGGSGDENEGSTPKAGHTFWEGLLCPGCLDHMGEYDDMQGHKLCHDCINQPSQDNIDNVVCPFCRIHEESKPKNIDDKKERVIEDLFQLGVTKCLACKRQPASYIVKETNTDLCFSCKSKYESLQKHGRVEYQSYFESGRQNTQASCPFAPCDKTITFDDLDSHFADHYRLQAELMEEKNRELNQLVKALGAGLRKKVEQHVTLDDQTMSTSLGIAAKLLNPNVVVNKFDNHGVSVSDIESGKAIPTSQADTVLVESCKQFAKDPVKFFLDQHKENQQHKEDNNLLMKRVTELQAAVPNRFRKVMMVAKRSLDAIETGQNIIDARLIDAEESLDTAEEIQLINKQKTQVIDSTLYMQASLFGKLSSALGRPDKRLVMQQMNQYFVQLKGADSSSAAGDLAIKIRELQSSVKTCIDCINVVEDESSSTRGTDTYLNTETVYVIRPETFEQGIQTDIPEASISSTPVELPEARNPELDETSLTFSIATCNDKQVNDDVGALSSDTGALALRPSQPLVVTLQGKDPLNQLTTQFTKALSSQKQLFELKAENHLLKRQNQQMHQVAAETMEKLVEIIAVPAGNPKELERLITSTMEEHHHNQVKQMAEEQHVAATRLAEKTKDIVESGVQNALKKIIGGEYNAAETSPSQTSASVFMAPPTTPMINPNAKVDIATGSPIATQESTASGIETDDSPYYMPAPIARPVTPPPIGRPATPPPYGYQPSEYPSDFDMYEPVYDEGAPYK